MIVSGSGIARHRVVVMGNVCIWERIEWAGEVYHLKKDQIALSLSGELY